LEALDKTDGDWAIRHPCETLLSGDNVIEDFANLDGQAGPIFRL